LPQVHNVDAIVSTKPQHCFISFLSQEKTKILISIFHSIFLMTMVESVLLCWKPKEYKRHLMVVGGG